MQNSAEADQYVGCLLGIAAGDSLGLPYEGLSAERGRRLFPDPGRHHLIFSKGMVSDDTEHACFVAKALIVAGNDEGRFASSLAWSLRFWLMGLPAGVGLATGRAIIKLWLGFSPQNSGVFSAGNGPAMRSPLLGLRYGHDFASLRLFVQASTRMTHTDPKAFYGALAVALATHMSAKAEIQVAPEEFLTKLRELLTHEDAEEFLQLLVHALESARAGQSAGQFARSIGSKNGVGGYIYHTVPVVMQVWFRFGRNYQGAMIEMISTGGDTDTTAAILGGIIGAGVGKSGIPSAWLEGIVEYPRSIAWMEQLASCLAKDEGIKPSVPGYAWWLIPIRNGLFFIIVLLHGFRRLLPPY